jgi:hypothetical protein
MLNRSKLVLVALSATVVLGALVSSASANRLALSNQTFRATWTNLEFVTTAFTAPVRCHVTIEGSFHSRTLAKVTEALVGYATAANLTLPCTGGTARLLTETLPWHIRYDSFAGTLPNITSIKLRLVGASFLVQAPEPFGRIAACLYRSTAASPMKGTVTLERGVATSLTPEAAGIPLQTRLPESQIECPNPGRLGASTSTLTVQGSTTKITVTLVA